MLILFAQGSGWGISPSDANTSGPWCFIFSYAAVFIVFFACSRVGVHADVGEKCPMWVLNAIASQRVYTKACQAQSIVSK